MEPNAILAINSLDRYNATQGANGRPASFAQSLDNQYNGTGQPCNNFQVGGLGALIYGYIKKIQVSQIQLQYNVPTVIPGANDVFTLFVVQYRPTKSVIQALIEIPFGFYTPQELTSVIQLQINASPLIVGTGIAITVAYEAAPNVFTFTITQPTSPPPATGQEFYLYFPIIGQIQDYLISIGKNPAGYLNILKAYRLLGINKTNAIPIKSDPQTSTEVPQFLYTPYVDIFSTALTKYQRVKDNTTNATSETSIIARIYLSGIGGPQNMAGENNNIINPDTLYPYPITEHTYPLGSRPFLELFDPNTPKVIRWSKDETVYALDFQLRDQYGDLLFTQYDPATTVTPIDPATIISPQIYYTEFQMTLMCIEGEK